MTNNQYIIDLNTDIEKPKMCLLYLDFVSDLEFWIRILSVEYHK